MNSISPGGGGGSISGGCDNLAGPGLVSDIACPNAGPDEWIGGGYANNVTDPFSSIAGGCDNVTGTARLPSSNCNRFNFNGEQAILGGIANRASARADSVSGGAFNTASGGHASVSGGESNTASAIGASVLGGSFDGASSNCESIPEVPNNSC